MKLTLSVAMFLVGLTPAIASTWKPIQFDPSKDGPADLVIPLPCDGSMAFTKVVTPASADNPLDDARFRLGHSSVESGFEDFQRNGFLRGPFADPDSQAPFYYIGRYEVTKNQLHAIRGECDAIKTNIAGTIPANNISWFEAVEITRLLSEWLRANAEDQLPTVQGVLPLFGFQPKLNGNLRPEAAQKLIKQVSTHACFPWRVRLVIMLGIRDLHHQKTNCGP